MRHWFGILLLWCLSSWCLAESSEGLQVGDSVIRFDGRGGLVLHVGGRELKASCLWRVHFAEKQGTVAATEFFAAPWQGRVATVREGGDAVRFEYRGTGLSLDVRLHCTASGVDWTVSVVETARAIERIDVPAGLAFGLSGMERFVFPQRGAECHGYAFLPDYFREHLPPKCHYRREVVGVRGYEHLYGGPLRQLADREPAVPLALTAEGRELFGQWGEEFFQRQRLLSVNRPPAAGQADLVLVDSAAGPALSGKHFGGKGWLLRFSGHRDDTDNEPKALIRTLFDMTMHGFQRREPERFRGKKLGIVQLRNGGVRGAWTAMTVREWRDCILGSALRMASRAELVELESVAEMRRALRNPEFALILNPYGEAFPCDAASEMVPLLDEVREFVRRGGFWWECGGYPFYLANIIDPYTRFGVNYPSAVADFAYADYGAAGGVAMYGVQPVMRRPWDRERVVTPARLEISGTGESAKFVHGWHLMCEAGETWRSPVWRLDVAHRDVRDALSRYAQVMEIGGSLEKKIPDAQLRERLKGAVLVRLGASKASAQIQAMSSLPAHSLVHYTEYLHGGFDKQYPDHFPVRKAWGTDDDYREFLRRGRELGHLMMPYTNTSWWCIEPKGPTFEREGEEPLNRQRHGQLRLERYANNKGYSLCFWHPAVQEAHRRVRRQMTEEFPCDVLFQDQVGARTWVWNYHPLEPRRASGHDGMLSLSMEDAEVVPMATEDGYDRVLNFESMICGAAWGMIPADHKHRERHAKYLFPRGEWEFFPILSYLGHGQCLFTTHDLGHFTDNPEKLAATLAFGYSLSLRWNGAQAQVPWQRHWLAWLDALQKSVCAAYAGQPLLDFRYVTPGSEDPVLYSRYGGDVVAVVNCGKEPVALRGMLSGVALPAAELAWLERQTLGGYGFYIRSPKARAGLLVMPERPDQACGFALREEADGRLDGVFYDYGSLTLTFPAPDGWAGRTLSSGDAAGKEAQELSLQDVGSGCVTVSLPQSSFREAQMPTALAASSPRQLGHDRRVLVVRNPAFASEKYQSECAELLALLRQRLAGTGLEVVEQTDLAELLRLLDEREAARRPFAVLSPGGEWFFGPAGITGPDMIVRIGAYVAHGGIWWCSGGYPFYIYGENDQDGKVKRHNVGATGAMMLGIVCPTGSVMEPKRVLEVTALGRRWLEPALVSRVEKARMPVQRPFIMDTGVISLVEGDGLPYVAGMRGNGWGYLFSMCGFGVPMDLWSDVASGVLKHLYHQAWERPNLRTHRQLWQVRGK